MGPGGTCGVSYWLSPTLPLLGGGVRGGGRGGGGGGGARGNLWCLILALSHSAPFSHYIVGLITSSLKLVWITVCERDITKYDSTLYTKIFFELISRGYGITQCAMSTS